MLMTEMWQYGDQSRNAFADGSSNNNNDSSGEDNNYTWSRTGFTSEDWKYKRSEGMPPSSATLRSSKDFNSSKTRQQQQKGFQSEPYSRAVSTLAKSSLQNEGKKISRSEQTGQPNNYYEHLIQPPQQTLQENLRSGGGFAPFDDGVVTKIDPSPSSSASPHSSTPPEVARVNNQPMCTKLPLSEKRDKRDEILYPFHCHGRGVPVIHRYKKEMNTEREGRVRSALMYDDGTESEEKKNHRQNSKDLPQQQLVFERMHHQSNLKHRSRYSRDQHIDTEPSKLGFRVEDMMMSSNHSQPHYLRLTRHPDDQLYPRYSDHYAHPHRHASPLEEAPVVVHQYDPGISRTSDRSKTGPSSQEAGDQSLRDDLIVIDNAPNNRRGYELHYQHSRGSPNRELGEIRYDYSQTLMRRNYSPHGYVPTNKESYTAAASATLSSAARDGTTSVSSSPGASNSPMVISPPPSLPPLSSLSPPTGRNSSSQISFSISHESSASSQTTILLPSSPLPPPRMRATLARSHVPKKHSNKDLCIICGDKASGYHYNTLSCEGCKGFFRRTITRNLHYQCKYGGNCVMDMWMRRKCPACRLKRCKQVGMREECLLTEHQCVVRNSRRILKMKLKKKEIVKELGPQTSKEGDPCGISLEEAQNILASLSSEHRELIERLVELQDRYELPSGDDLLLLKEEKMFKATCGEDLSEAIFVHMVEMTILVTRLIVEFAKNLPGFRNLLKEDQIVLLKSSSSEVMMLRTARRYDPDSNTIVFGNGVPFTPTSMAFGGLQDSVKSLFEFSTSMSSLYVDNTEYALLTAICIFSIRSGLTSPSVVDKLQEVYTEVLLAYISKRRSKCPNFLAKLLMKLVLLRTLGLEHSQTLYSLTLKKGNLPPLLTEYFDIIE